MPNPASALPLEILRRIDAAGRFALMVQLTEAEIRRARDEIAALDPGLSELEVRLRWAEKVYGRRLADAVRLDLVRRSSIR